MDTTAAPRPGQAWNHMIVIGRGANRVCVIDRRDTRQCLKFMLPPAQRTRVGLRQRLARWRAQRKPARDENHAELRAWLQLSARIPAEELAPHLATVLGMFRTVYGQALCCQRVTLPEGGDAPSLYALLFEAPRYPAATLCAAVSVFEQWLLRHRIPLFDLNAGNLLVLPDGDGVRLVCVDAKSVVAGKEIVPFSRWVGALGRRKIRRRAERLRARIRAALPDTGAPASAP
ncbi:YrbL family protein [Pseudoxanthomonas winnipegensis]|uniref:YrbL family protein n=1 Tax=Pseudoxanthomonas winnipegensis TaxID=2480810 RepID=UPI003F870AC9